MNKNKIIILAVCAVVVIGGAIAAVPILRNRNTPEIEAPSVSQEEVSETSGNYEFPSYVYEEPESESVADPAVNADTAADGSVLTTVKELASVVVNSTTGKNPANGSSSGRNNTTTTTAKNTKNTTTTTKKSSGNNTQTGLVPNAIGDEAEQSFLGYRYSSDGYYYCDDKDCWQKNVGYNEVYDKWAPVAGMYIDQVRIRFQYDKQNYMIQFWKGQYGFLLIGAEIGIYTCDLDDYQGNTGDLNHFYCADKSDWLKMQLDCYYCQGGKGQYTRIFTRPYDTYWWATGFVKGQLTKYTAPRTELKTRNRITFKSEEQANIFVQGLKVAGFRRAAASDQLVDDSYFASGKDVWVLWSTIQQDCFVGYGNEAKKL